MSLFPGWLSKKDRLVPHRGQKERREPKKSGFPTTYPWERERFLFLTFQIVNNGGRPKSEEVQSASEDGLNRPLGLFLDNVKLE